MASLMASLAFLTNLAWENMLGHPILGVREQDSCGKKMVELLMTRKYTQDCTKVSDGFGLVAPSGDCEAPHRP